MTVVDPSFLPNALPDALRLPIDRFIDRLDSALLRAGIPRPARHSVLGAVESDLLRRIQDRSHGTPDGAAVTSALDELGASAPPAEAIAADPRAWRAYLAVTLPRRSRCAWWGAVLAVLSLLPMVLILLAVMLFSPSGIRIQADFDRDRVHTEVGAAGPEVALFHAQAPDGSISATSSALTPLARFYWLFLPVSPLALAATLLGLIALIDIRRSKGKLTGTAPALFATLFYPLLLAIITCWLL